MTPPNHLKFALFVLIPALAVLYACRLGVENPVVPAMSSHKTAFIYSDTYLEHDQGPGHPERPERLSVIVAALKSDGLLKKLLRPDPSPAELKWLASIHDGDYIERVRQACERAPINLGPDTAVSRGSFDAAVLAAGGVMVAVDAVMEGKVRNAFCAIRPPGHHATRDGAMGFCIFNNVAIAARYIQGKYGLKRVLIVDWDAHHGNGTQDAFYEDQTVLYFSIHQYPYYPGSGAAGERGKGNGEGFTINVPLKAGSGDTECVAAFRETLLPAAEEFKPDFVLISAGFDTHEDDPLTDLSVTEAGFVRMTEIVKGIAESYCDGRLVSVLEGGYGLQAVGGCVAGHVRILATSP